MRVLVACEFSGVVAAAFRARGAEAWSCDLLPTEGDPRWHQNKLPPSEDRWKLRSKTYAGLAAAMAAQWGNSERV